MDYITIKEALTTTLSDNAASRFKTVGYERQTKSADRIKENKLVQAFYESGSFPLQGGYTGPIDHDMIFKIRLTVVADASGDIATIDDTNSTVEERATAIQNILEAASLADSEIDDLISVVWNILMDATNKFLGLDRGFISNRWITSIKKDQTVEDGEYAVKTAEITYVCSTCEPVTGDTATILEEVVFDNVVQVSEEEETKTGIEITNS